MTAAVLALALFVAVFALATLRGVHLGIAMFVAACIVGTTLAGMTLREVVAGFPVGIVVLVAGVTYFFGIAHLNGTIDRVIGALVARAGARRAVVPLVFAVLAAVAAAMGSSQAGLATGPPAMSTARRARVDAVLMALAINCGICAGAFAPTSLFGIITYGIARDAGIDVSPWQLLVVALVSNLVLLVAALIIFRRPPEPGTAADTGTLSAAPAPRAVGAAAATPAATAMTASQVLTMVCLAGLIPGLIAGALAGYETDIGVTLLSLGALLALVDPPTGARAVSRIDWPTAFVVVGIATYVGVLQKLDAINLLGRAAMTIGSPMAAAILICMVAALVSAFASTTAVLAALVPMAVPLAASGAVPGWALITTLGVSATIVDCSPFSNSGATLIASAPEEARPRLRVLLLRWSLAMVVLGPIVLLPVLVVLAG